MIDVHIDTQAANYIIGENKHTCWVYVENKNNWMWFYVVGLCPLTEIHSHL